MKTYKEISENVLAKRDEYFEKRKARNKIIRRSAVVFSALLLLVGAVFWQKNFSREIGVANSFASLDSETHNDEIIPENSGQNDETHNDVNIPFSSDNSGEEVSKITYKLVESFEGNADTSYATPKNGEIGFSEPLRQAIEHHKDEDVLYRIYIDLFKNEEPLSHEEMRSEMNRLISGGYTVVEDKYFDGENYHYYFSLHITNEGLENLTVSDEYGMFLFFFDERVTTE